MSDTTITAIFAAFVAVALLAFVGPSDLEEELRQEAWNCANHPRAFDYCADVLAGSGK